MIDQAQISSFKDQQALSQQIEQGQNEEQRALQKFKTQKFYLQGRTDMRKRLKIALSIVISVIITLVLFYYLKFIPASAPQESSQSQSLEEPSIPQTALSTQNNPDSSQSPIPIQASEGPEPKTLNYKPIFQKYSETLDLQDFTTDTVYINADQQMKEVFNEMIKRPDDLSQKNEANTIFMPSQKAYFAYSLYKNPNNTKYKQAEYYYYDQKYNISKYPEQLKVCIVAPGRNIVQSNKYMGFIDSINSLNYTNYKLIYIDDVSTDNSSQALKKYIQQTNGPLLQKQKFVLVQNQERIYALGNRDLAIRKFCDEDSIVADVDADDAFIGSQALKVVNAIYQDPNIWQLNSVFIYVDPKKNQVSTGPQDGVPAELLEKNRYRGSLIWKTSELRTFRQKLFTKINQSDFKNPNDNNKYYKWASDVFTQEPLIELAGKEHYRHIYQIMYFYNWSFDKSTVYKRRYFRNIAFMQTPYQKLQSLDDVAVKEEGYAVSDRIKWEYQNGLRYVKMEASRYGREVEV